MHTTLDIDLRVNVRVIVRERGKLVTTRQSHNTFTNTGRAWLVKRLGSNNLVADPPTPIVSSLIKYMGLGCGGMLQTDTNICRSQPEIVTVTHLEDPVPYSTVVTTSTYLKPILPTQITSPIFLPAFNRIVFIRDVIEGEIAFANNSTRVSNYTVGTRVPVSEVGLYLSEAKPTFTPPIAQNGEADPAGPNHMVAYNIFDPVPVTPNRTIRVEWELRV